MVNKLVSTSTQVEMSSIDGAARILAHKLAVQVLTDDEINNISGGEVRCEPAGIATVTATRGTTVDDCDT